jgi:hypothetical protein
MAKKKGMISSCKDCKSICCKTGPGPHKPLMPDEYLENFGTTDAYNTKCVALKDDGLCSLWGSAKFPMECRTYVCQSRTFKPAELKKIDTVYDRECSNCDAEWQYLVNHKDGSWAQECPVCGKKYEYELKKKKGK